MTEAFIYDALRTPRGRGKETGSLHATKPVSLVVGLLDELRKRNPGLDPAQVEDVILGVVSPVGEQGADIARTAALAAGYETSGPGFQLNRFCASGLEALNIGAQKVRSGWEDLIVSGGVGADLIATIEGFSRTDVDTYAAESQDRAAKAIANGNFARSVIPVVDINGQVVLEVDEFPRAG